MTKRDSLKRILSFIGRYKALLLLSSLAALLTVALTLYVPILIGDAIDLIIGVGEVDISSVISIMITVAIMVGITALLQWIMSYINNKTAYNVSRDLRNSAFSKLEKLPLSYLDTHKSGDVVSRIISDVEQVSDGLLLGFSQLFVGVATIIGTLGFMLYLNWIIALVVVLLTPISLFIAKYIGTHTRDMFTLRQKTNGEETSHIDEVINNQKVIIAFSREDEVTETFDEINGRLERASLRAIFYSSLVNPTTRFVNSIVYAAVALVGAISVISGGGILGAISVGMLTTLLSYTNQYTKPFNEISGVITEFQNALASAGRVFELIDSEEEIKDKDDAITQEGVKGEIELRDVSFQYDESRPLIKKLNVKATPGMKVAIVGPTGCGKTTLINLLMRFYDVKGGSILLDGVDIRDITRKSLRESFGMVLQDTWLRYGTVKDNIRIGKPDATDEEVIKAAKKTHAHSFIKRMPNGYDTIISETDGDLSQGQKQLICITRVMLTLPPMLILDEATSSIDTRTEIKIQKAFSEMCEGRTSFIVAHRLSTIKESDLILVMKDGSVIEQGTHDELLQKGGFYRELYDSQFAH